MRLFRFRTEQAVKKRDRSGNSLQTTSVLAPLLCRLWPKVSLVHHHLTSNCKLTPCPLRLIVYLLLALTILMASTNAAPLSPPNWLKTTRFSLAT